MTGTTNPSGVSTATPILKYFFRISVSPSGSSEALNLGNAFSEATMAFIRKTNGASLKRLDCFDVAMAS